MIVNKYDDIWLDLRQVPASATSGRVIGGARYAQRQSVRFHKTMFIGRETMLILLWRYLCVAGICVAFGVLSVGCDGESSGETETDVTDDGDTNPPEEEELRAVDQTLSLTTALRVEHADVSETRWIAVYQDGAIGESGGLLGVVRINAGSHDSIIVPLEEPLSDGMTVHLQLHAEGGTPRAFEPDEGDVAVQGVDVVAIHITVEPQTPDIRIRLSGGVPNYELRIEPQSSAADAPEIFDPVLSLRSGMRYEVVNEVYQSHPWELTNSADEELLSQQEGNAGTLEEDADIAWFDNEDGLAEFTVTEELAAEVVEYQCGFHSDSMTNEVKVSLLIP